MEVAVHEEVEVELTALPPRERAAMLHAFEKLEAVGSRLPFPHSSQVRGRAEGLRELRPRSGRSPWRALYRQVGSRMVIAAIAREARRDPTGFISAVRKAERRLDALGPKPERAR